MARGRSAVSSGDRRKGNRSNVSRSCSTVDIADELVRTRARHAGRRRPANGYEAYHWSQPAMVRTSEAKPQPHSLLPLTLENEFLKLTVDPKTGCITSLFDKRSKTEALAPAVAGVGAPPTCPTASPAATCCRPSSTSRKQWDAWNVDADFIEHHTDILKADEVKLIENTPLRAVIRVTHTWQKLQLRSGHHALRRSATRRRATCRPTGTRSTSC